MKNNKLVRDGWPYQNGWIFGKIPNGLWPPPPPLISGKSYCVFFPEFMTEEPFIMAKICNINFWIGNDPPPPFGTFPKKHPFWYFQSSLSIGSLIIMIDISLAESPGPGAWSVLMASWRGFCCYCTEWLILPKYPQMHIQSKYKYNFSEFTNPYSEVNK